MMEFPRSYVPGTDRILESKPMLGDARGIVRWPLGIPNHLYWLFVGALCCVVLPFFDIPLLGLSLSAPVLFMVIGEVYFRGGHIRPLANRFWGRISLWLSGGVIASFVMSLVLNEEVRLSGSDILLAVRFIFWFLVFLVTATVFSNLSRPSRLISILGWSVVGLGIVRLVGFGVLGLEAPPPFFPKNVYGFIFSSFLPFAVVLVFHKGFRGTLGRIAVGVLIVAVLLNRSRGNWIGVFFELVLIGWFLVISRGGRTQGAKVALAILFVGPGLFLLIPDAVWTPVTERFESFETASDEKSVLVRKVMVQKSKQLFLENPIFGVGPGRFTRSMVDLKLPKRLGYYTQPGINRRSAHNSWMQWLAETGLVGSIPLFILVGILLGRGYKSVRFLVAKGHSWAVAPWAGMVGMGVHMWVVSGLIGTHAWVVFGLVAGSIVWANEMTKNRWQRPTITRSVGGLRV